MNCSNPDCGENTIVSEFRPEGLVRYCNRCKAPVAAAQKVAPQPAAPSGGIPPVGASATKPDLALMRAAGQLTPTKITALARARIAELNREIKHLKSLVRERDELKRLLTAAKKKPQDGGAVVRPLRKQG